MSSDKERGVEAVQGLVVLVGITLGVLPLIGAFTGIGSGLLGVILPNDNDSLRYVVPLVIVAAAVIAVLVREALGKRR